MKAYLRVEPARAGDEEDYNAAKVFRNGDGLDRVGAHARSRSRS